MREKIILQKRAYEVSKTKGDKKEKRLNLCKLVISLILYVYLGPALLFILSMFIFDDRYIHIIFIITIYTWFYLSAGIKYRRPKWFKIYVIAAIFFVEWMQGSLLLTEFDNFFIPLLALIILGCADSIVDKREKFIKDQSDEAEKVAEQYRKDIVVRNNYRPKRGRIRY